MLRSFFAQLELTGDAPVAPRELGCDDAALAALRAEGIVLRAPRATRWPCEAIGCARVVVAIDDGVVAVCTREDEPCETLTLAREELERVRASLDTLFDVVRRELRIEAPRRAPPASGGPRYLGVQGIASPRDVFFELRPRSSTVAAFLATREHAPRPTLLLVPEIASIDPDVVVAHAPGAKVEIDALADALAVRGGRIMIAPRLRKAHVPSVPREAAPTAHVAPLAPRPRRWTDLTILGVDKQTIIAKVGRRAQKMTHVDLGLARKNTREPMKHFLLLLAICAGNGQFRWKEFGSFEAAMKLVSRLRKALCAVFGIEENPFYEFSHEHQWRAKFQAAMASDEEKKSVATGRAWAAEESDAEPEAESAWSAASEDWSHVRRSREREDD